MAFDGVWTRVDAMRGAEVLLMAQDSRRVFWRILSSSSRILKQQQHFAIIDEAQCDADSMRLLTEQGADLGLLQRHSAASTTLQRGAQASVYHKVRAVCLACEAEMQCLHRRFLPNCNHALRTLRCGGGWDAQRFVQSATLRAMHFAVFHAHMRHSAFYFHCAQCHAYSLCAGCALVEHELAVKARQEQTKRRRHCTSGELEAEMQALRERALQLEAENGDLKTRCESLVQTVQTALLDTSTT